MSAVPTRVGDAVNVPDAAQRARARRRWLSIGLSFLVLCFLAAHLGALRGSLLADDFFLIRSMCTATGEPDLVVALRQFGQPIPGVEAPLPADLDPKFWRPVWRLSFFVDRTLWGTWAPGYFGTNLLVHGTAALLLLGLLLRMGLPAVTACGAATLFAVHPSHHEAVWWPASRGDLLATAFGLGAAFVVAGGPGERGGRSARDGGGAERGGDWRRSASVAGLLLLALWSKESALTTPGLLVGVALLASAGRGRPILRRLGILALPGLVFLAYLAARRWILGVFLGGYGSGDGGWLDGPFWANQRATLLALLRFARGDVPGAWLGSWILGALLLVGAAALAQEARREAELRVGGPRAPVGLGWLPACAAWLGLALLPTWQFAVHAGTHEGARFLYGATAAAGTLIAVCVHRAARWLPGRARLPVEAAALGALCLVSIGLLHEATGPRRAAWVAADRLFPALRAVPLPGEGATLVFVDLPDGIAAAYIARNALPDALMPPFVPAAPRGTVIGVTDARPEQLQALDPLARDPATRFRRWESATGALRPVSLR